ncbi:unnamed protein product [Brassica oleracea]
MVERWRFLDLLQRRLFCLGRIRLAIDAMAKNSLRCVAIACRTQELNKVPKEQEDLDKWSLLEDELTLLAIVGIKIPPRPPRLSYGSKNGIGRGRREAPLKCHRTPTTLSATLLLVQLGRCSIRGNVLIPWKRSKRKSLCKLEI